MTDSNPYATPDSAVEVDHSEGYGELNYHNRKGRIGRVRYIAWSGGLGMVFYLIMMVGMGIFAALGGPVGFMAEDGTMNSEMLGSAAGITLIVVAVIIYIVMIVYMFRFTIKRCHDFDASGWLSLLLLIPLLPLIFWFISGSHGENRYGLPAPPDSTGVKVLFWLFAAFVGISILGIIAAVFLPLLNQT